MLTTIHTSTWARDLMQDIATAERLVFLTALSLLPPRTVKIDDFTRLWLSIIDASARGVSIVVALPAPALAHPATLHNERAKAAIEQHGGTTFLVPAVNLLHAKTCQIDARIAWVGSGNFTPAAAHHNRECYMRTIEPQAVATLAAFHAALTK